MPENIIITNDCAGALRRIIADAGNPRVFVIADENTARLCVPRLRLDGATLLTTPAGDENKNLGAAATLWEKLSASGATRSSLAVCAGGGMVTDLGGFVASTFKRGMPYVNVPTTLLGAVDASTGGKTGINFAGLKNEIGVFSQPLATVAGTCFFDTLPAHELMSGYAEMLKHALLEGPDALDEIMDFDPLTAPDSPQMLELMRKSIGVKQRIVESDPREKGPRKALNAGHTAGHALESLVMERGRNEGHGYAVARGLVTELVLSHMKLGFPSDILYRVAAFVREHYGPADITCDDYPRLIGLMRHDKKNSSTEAINFTLFSAPGEAHINRTASEEEITAALDIYRDLTGC